MAPPAGKRQLTGGRKAKQLLVPEERNTTANAILSHWKGFENKFVKKDKTMQQRNANARAVEGNTATTVLHKGHIDF